MVPGIIHTHAGNIWGMNFNTTETPFPSVTADVEQFVTQNLAWMEKSAAQVSRIFRLRVGVPLPW